MARIKTNVVGKVGNMSLSHDNGVMALHEAIVNSLQSIDYAQHLNRELKGEVIIEVRRDQTAEIDEDGLQPVQDILITDNGIGFTAKNYTSFQTAESTYKQKLGGKGIGRFLWLKVFGQADVRSIYRELKDQKLYNRSFSFVLDNKHPIVDEQLVPLVAGDTRTTGATIILRTLQPEYAASFSGPLSELADSIIEHHIHFLVDDSCPEIILREKRSENDSFEYHLKHRFKQEFLIEGDSDSITIGNYVFELAFLKVRNEGNKVRHAILYSANKRVVLSHPLSQLIPNLIQPLQFEDGESFDILVLVSSYYLDQHVNGERTKLTIPNKPPTRNISVSVGKPLLSLAEIEEEIVEHIYAYLGDYLANIRMEKQAHLQSFVNKSAPQYRTLLNYPHLIDKIKPNLTDEKLDIELHKVRNELVIESKISLAKILNGSSSTPNTSAFDSELTSLVTKISDVSQSNLVDYVVHRKMILRLFERVLERRPDGKYELEKQIHNIVFPMQKTSNEVLYEEHNLWLIDERLAYHKFLQSDQPLNPEEKDSSRPDILLSFDKALLYTDSKKSPYEAFTIIEFKRPMRDGYADSGDPIRQVLSYIEDIQEGKARTPEGRPIMPSKSCKYYCYIVCDLTAPIHKFARFNSLTPTPDEIGYFGFNPNYNAYIEVLSFDKLVEDSKQRNQILFDKLGITHA